MKKILKILALLACAALALTLFALALKNVEGSAAQKGREQLETALRQAAVACYAAEGIYPPKVSYLQQHYGIQIDEERYLVSYDIFADNLMPSILVIER